jgi:hypothetical protein
LGIPGHHIARNVEGTPIGRFVIHHILLVQLDFSAFIGMSSIGRATTIAAITVCCTKRREIMDKNPAYSVSYGSWNFRSEKSPSSKPDEFSDSY